MKEKDNDFLMRLYMACSNQEMTYDEGLNLGELWEETKEVSETSGAFESALIASPLNGSKDEDTLYSAYICACCAHEACGFINGFRMAARILRELKPEAAV